MYLFKKSYNHSHKRERTYTVTGEKSLKNLSITKIENAIKNYQEEIKLPSGAIGLVIGKNGKTIKSIMAESGAHIWGKCEINPNVIRDINFSIFK